MSSDPRKGRTVPRTGCHATRATDPRRTSPHRPGAGRRAGRSSVRQRIEALARERSSRMALMVKSRRRAPPRWPPGSALATIPGGPVRSCGPGAEARRRSRFRLRSAPENTERASNKADLSGNKASRTPGTLRRHAEDLDVDIAWTRPRASRRGRIRPRAKPAAPPNRPSGGTERIAWARR